MPDKLTEIYNAYKADGVTKAQSEQQFRNWMAGKNYRAGIYNDLKRQGAKLGTFEEFSERLGYKQKSNIPQDFGSLNIGEASKSAFQRSQETNVVDKRHTTGNPIQQTERIFGKPAYIPRIVKNKDIQRGLRTDIGGGYSLEYDDNQFARKKQDDISREANELNRQIVKEAADVADKLNANEWERILRSNARGNSNGDIAALSAMAKGFNERNGDAATMNKLIQAFSNGYFSDANKKLVEAKAKELGVDPYVLWDKMMPGIEQAVRDRYVEKNMPKNEADYVVRGLKNSLLGQIGQRFVTTSDERELINEGEQRYAEKLEKEIKDKGVVSLAGAAKYGNTALGMAADILPFSVAGAGSKLSMQGVNAGVNFITKTPLGKRLLGRFMGTTAKELTEKYGAAGAARIANFVESNKGFFGTLLSDGVKGTLQSGLTLGNYGAMSYLVGEGADKIEKGDTKNWVGGLLSSYGDEFLTGLKFGAVGAVGSSWGRRVGITGAETSKMEMAKNALKKAAITTGAFAAESLAFRSEQMWDEWSKDHKVDVVDNFIQGACENLAMKIGSGHIKSWHPANILRSMTMSGVDNRLVLSSAEKKEFLANTNARNLLEACEALNPDRRTNAEMGIEHKPNYRHRSLGGHDTEGNPVGYLQQFLEDKTISFRTRQKVAAALGGVISKVVPRTSRIVVSEDNQGIGVVKAYAEDGELLSIDTCRKGEAEAKKQELLDKRDDSDFKNAYNSAITSLTDDESAEIGEQAAKELGYKSYADYVEKNANIASLNTKAEKKKFDEAVKKKYAAKVGEKTKAVLDIQREIGEEFGLDMDKVIAKDPVKRTDEEKKAIAEFNARLRDRATDKNNEKQQAQLAKQNGADKAEQTDVNNSEEFSAAAAEVNNRLTEASTRWMQMLETNPDLAEWVKANPDADVSEMRELFGDEAADAYLELSNAQAAKDGFTNHTGQKIEDETQKQVEQSVFTGTINGEEDKDNVCLLNGQNGESYVLVGGEVTIDENGKIELVSDGGIAIVRDENGNIAQLTDLDGYKANRVSMEDYANTVRTGLQEQKTKEIQASEPEAPTNEEGGEKPSSPSGGSEDRPNGENRPNIPIKPKGGDKPDEPKGNGGSVPPANGGEKPNTPEGENKPSEPNENGGGGDEPEQPTFRDGAPVPMNENGEPDFNKMSPEQGAELYRDTFGDEAEKLLDDEIKKAEKDLKNAQKMKVGGGSWSEKKASMKAKEEAEAEAQRRLEMLENIKKALTAKKVEEGMGEKPANSGANDERTARAKTKFDNAPKLKGRHGTRTLSNGMKLSGTFYIVPAESLTPSHNALDGYKKNEDFPVTEDGKTANNRDYESDKDAQTVTDGIANNYDGQAVSQVPVVSDEGVVYDGNGRTMAGQKAAVNGKDKAYTESLIENIEGFGVTAEELEKSGIEHPRVVFVLDERLPYDTKTFALFNKQEKKTQNNTNVAIENSKKLTPKEIGSIIAEISENKTLDSFFNSPKAINNLIKTLVYKGIIGQNEVAGLKDGDLLSAAGEEFVENLLLGSFFKEETIKELGIEKGLKRKVLSAIKSVMDNAKLGEYNLGDEIDQAVQLLYEAKRYGSKVATLLREQDFVNGNAADRYPTASQIMALALEGKVDDFRELIEIYNNTVNGRVEGKVDLFGDTPTKEEILNEVLKLEGWSKYGIKPKETKQEGHDDVGGSEGTEPQTRGKGEGNGGGVGGNKLKLRIPLNSPEVNPDDPIETAAALYRKDHPLTDEDILNTTAFDDLPEDRKQYCIDAALDYLHGEDDSAISEAYYRQIYANRKPTRPKGNGGGGKTDAPIDPQQKGTQYKSDKNGGEKPATPLGGTAKTEKPKEKTREELEAEKNAADDEFDAFMKDLRKKRGGQLNSGFIDQHLIEAAPKMFSLAAKCAYTRIKLGMFDAKEIIKDLKARFKEAFDGFDKKDIETFYSEIMKQKWRDGNERMSLNDWAEHYKKLSPEHQKKLAGDSKLAEEKKQKENVFISNLKMIMGGRKVDGIRELRQLAKELGLEGVKDTDLQELAETAVVSRARDIASSKAMSEERKFAEMKKLYENQPTFSQRDSERVAKQQYSTPAPYAYLADMYVKGNGKEINSALEPSAGNGMLTIGLPIDKVHVNDIDEARVLNLNRQGFKIVTSQDGTQPFGDKNVDIVVTNPPFGTTAPRDYDGYKISSLEGQMAINALESMKDDGRAAIIIGGKTEYAQNGSLKPKDKAFLGYLYSHYNVEDVINVDGSLYAKQGTTYPTRIILINGRRLNENSFPPVKDKAKAETVKDYDELYKRINDDLLRSGRLDTTSGEGTRKVRPESDKQSTDDSDGKGLPIRGGKRSKHEATDVSSGLSGEGMVRLGENGLGNGRGAERGTEGGLSEGDTGANTTRTEPSQSEGGKYHPNRIRRVQEQGGSGRTASQPNANGTSDVGRGRLAVKEKEERDLTSEKVTYTPKSGNPFTLQSVMPADQQEAVNKNLEKLGDVDQFLINELGYNDKEDLYKHLAAEQIDAVAMAIHQAQQGNGFIIGDMTGIGKGRQAASLIRYAKRQGQVPIYFTRTAGLLSDVYRDLVDIGSSELRPFVFGSSNEAAITDSDGNVVYKLPSEKEEKRVLDYIEKNGKLPEEYDYVLTTYSQVQNGLIEYGENGSRKENGKKPTPAALNGQRKRDAIEKLVGNGYLILDESHTAGGNSSQGNYFQHIIQKTKSVTFFSATFAKRPDNMPIYALRTAMNKGGLKASELIEAVRRGGTTLQEVMSWALTECGQMIRRERDMTGVTIDWKAIDDPEKVEEQRAQYDSIIGLFNDIINFQKTYVNEYIDKKNTQLAAIQASIDIKRGTAALGIKNTPFASKAFNTVQQVLLSLKAKSAAERAVEYLKKDMKPVIALSNTNESQTGGIALGEEMDAPDLSVSLKKGLAGTLRYTTKGAKNDSESGYIKLSDLGEEATKAYYELEKKIEQSSTGLSLSPIDVIKNVIEGAGYKVGELTGRTTEFVYNENGTVTKVKRTETDKKKLARQFNDGELDALILNKSAATGISLHASSKFKDTKKRVMIVAQQQLDVNDEVQMRGRIDRTGQLFRGAYEYVVSLIPAEQRLLMMFKAKLKSLDANTTSSQKSKFNEMEVADITNKYGDSVVREYMAEHLDLYAKMADPFGWESAYGDDLETIDPQKLVTTRGDVRNGEAGQDANKLLGRMALLKVAEQEKMLQEISDLYAAEINRLSEMGENDLEITEMPLKAKTLDKAVWRKGSEPNGDNAFADNTYVEKVNMAVLRKPMKAEEVKKAQDGLTGGKTWEEYKEEKKAAVKAYYDQKIEEATQKNEERAVKLATKAREKYIKDAKRGQKNSGMSDEQIEKMADFQYKNIYDGEKEKLDTIVKNFSTKADAFERVLDTFSTEEAYALPADMNNPSEMSAFGNSYGRLIDIKITDNFSPNASSVSFATMDGRRKVTFPISGKVGKGDSKTDVITSISTMTKQAVSAGDKHLKVLAMDAANWDRLTPNENRKDGYIITGNLIQALVDTSAQGAGGQLMKYTTDTGKVKTGILMSERFEPKAIHNDVPISEMTDKIHDGIRHGSIENVTSSDGEVKITWRYDYIKGGLSYQIRVPKSQKRGGKYFMDKGLLDLVEGKNFETRGNSMMAEFREDSLRPILDRLSKLGVKVQEEKTDTERYQEAKKSGFEQFMEDAPETENIKTSDRSAMQKFSDRVLSFRSAETKDYPTYNAQKTTVRIKADNLFRSEKDWFSLKKYGNSIAFHDKENGCSYELYAYKDAQGYLKSVFVAKYHDFKDGADSKPRLQKVDSEDLSKGYRDERYQKTDGTTKVSEREKTLRDAVVETMKSAGLDVSMDMEEGQRVLDEANGEVRMQAKMSALTKAANSIRNWLTGNKRNKAFTIELPLTTQRMIRKVMGRDFESHVITANNIAHAYKNHGVNGAKITDKSIPLTKEDMELLPYIMTAPDYIRKGSDDTTGRESVRFYKTLNNGYVIVVEKEQKDSPNDMETITMWAEKSSSNVADARTSTSPTIDARNVIISTEDAAKIRKDAENAIENDVNIRKQRVYHGSGADITDHVRFFRTKDGEAYGYTVGGKIYIDPRIANSETPVHEYAHLWATALRSGNAEEWKNVVGLMKGTSVWEEVKKRYPELKTDDDIADEVLATYSGRRGAERLREEMDNAKGDAKSALQRVKEAIERFWKTTADMLHIHYTSAEEIADRVMKDLLDGVDPRKMGEPHEGGYNLHKVTDKEELEKLDKEKTFRMYSSMQEVDGKLYSPMAAIIGGKRSDAAEIGAWMKADEHPELVKDGKFTLVKTDGKKGLGEGDVGAAYNPYMHTSSSMMNDQFTGAYARGNIKVVEWEVPESEKTSGYHAEGAKNSVGIVPWHSGSVNGLLPKERQRSVMLSKYRKGVRVVPDSEVAEKIANQLRGTGLAIPWNVVTPNQLEELAKIGVPITTEESGTQAKETKAKFEAQKAELEEKYPQAHFVNVKMTKEAHKEWGKDGGTRYRKGEAPEESVQRDNATKRKAVDETVKKSGSKVNVHESVDDIDNPEVKSAIERGENVKGWYDTKTGEVHLYMPNVTDKYDAQKTIAHETIGHKGMRGLLGEQGYRELMRNLYTHMSKEEAAEVNRRMMENGWDFYTAMDEYVADKAEDMVWNPKAATFWENVKHYVTEAINRIGYRIKPNVNDVKYWLWESKRALNNGDALNSMKRNSFLWKLRRGQKARLDDIVSFNGKDGVTDEDVLQVRQLYKKGSLKPDKNDTPLTSATKQAIDDALNSASFKRNECWMDSKHGLKVLIDNMGKGLKKGMNSSMDAYHGAINQSSIVAEKQENLNRQQLATLNDKVKDCTLKLGGGERGYEDLNRYVYAKSGLERNRVLLVRDTAEKIGRKIKEMNKAIALDAKAKGEEPKLLSMSAVELFRDGRFREEKEWQDELLKKGKISLTEYCGNLDHCIKTFQFASTGDKELDEHINDLNNWIREEIQDKYDPNKNDYSGILSMTEFHDDDEVNEANIIDFVMQTENTLGEDSVKELWSSIREVTQFSLDNDYNYGLIDKSAHDRASSMFTFYVPMRGFKGGSAEDSYAYMRDENSGANAGNTLIHAKGRTTLGESIFGTMANLAQRSISRGEDNKNKQRLYRLAYQWVKDHTDENGNLTEEPPMIVSDVWYVKKRDETTGEEYWEPELPNIDDEMSEKAVRAKIERFEQNMQNAEKNGTATRVAPKARYDKPFKVADHKNEHIVFVKIGGKTKMVIFPGNPRPAQAINGDTQFGGNQNKLMRVMAAAFTSYNPTFLVSNTSRDTIFAHNNVSIRESAQYLARFTKNQAMLLSGIKQKDGETGRRNKAGYYGLLTKYKKGIKPETKLEEYFKEFMDNGGRTGFVKAKTIKDLEEEIKNNAMRGKVEESITKALLYLPEVIETANARFENVNRFAAYLTSRQEGRSVMRSVSDAKEVSTNFNRSGAGSKAYKNASRLEKMSGYTYDFFRNTKLFFNAGMQSLVILSTNVKNHPWKTVATTVASSMVAGGLIIPALNYLIAYATGEDDMYSELPEWDRRNNICIYLTHGSFLKIPLPIEIRGFYGLGDVALGAMRPEYRSNDGIALDALKQLTQILPIDFMGDGSGVIGSLLPTVIQPVYHTIVNKGWTGKPLYKDTPYNQNDPEYTKAFKSENDWLVGISKLINSASGGTDDTKGVLDHKYMNNPAVWGELISGYTGGAGSDALRATGFASRVTKMDWSDFSTREIPLLRGFISTPTERTKYYRSLNRYYKYKEDAEKYGHDLNKSLKSSDPMVRNRALRDIYEKKPEYIMYQKVNNLEKELSRKRQSIKALNPSEEQKKIYQDQMNDKKVDLVYELEGRERKEAKDKDKK